MNKIKIIADDKIPFLADSPLSDRAEMQFLPGSKISKLELSDADAVITRTRTKCGADSLDGTNVRAIATATIGFDHIDTAYCDQHRIVWRNAPGCNSGSVAQYLASLLTVEAIRKQWNLKEKTIGIVGAGNVGKKVISVAGALGLNILICDPPRAELEGRAGFCSLDTIREKADIITFHVPLQRDGIHATYHLADEAFFRSLHRNPLIVNTSRGEVVDGAALKTALQEKRISGAALDVWEKEPDIDTELLDLLDIATPHIAGYSTDGKANGTAMSIHFLADFFGFSGMGNWYPVIPPPPNPTLEIETPADAILASYDIRNDDARLRNSPETFEKQRGNYPLRREFSAFRIQNSESLSMESRKVLRLLGFQE